MCLRLEGIVRLERNRYWNAWLRYWFHAIYRPQRLHRSACPWCFQSTLVSCLPELEVTPLGERGWVGPRCSGTGLGDHFRAALWLGRTLSSWPVSPAGYPTFVLGGSCTLRVCAVQGFGASIYTGIAVVVLDGCCPPPPPPGRLLALPG